MVMAKIVMGRNGSRPKMSRHRHMASDAFILKFALVSELQRHKTDVRLNLYATVQCKKALAERQLL